MDLVLSRPTIYAMNLIGLTFGLAGFTARAAIIAGGRSIGFGRHD